MSARQALSEVLPAFRDVYRRDREARHLRPWELQHVLWSLGYTDELADEGEIRAAIEVARDDWPEWRAA